LASHGRREAISVGFPPRHLGDPDRVRRGISGPSEVRRAIARSLESLDRRDGSDCSRERPYGTNDDSEKCHARRPSDRPLCKASCERIQKTAATMLRAFEPAAEAVEAA
jgi:hypothetical protein